MKIRKSNLDGVHHWPGIYQFELPYLTGHNVPDDSGLIKVYNCDVEMHVSGEDNLNNGFIATVVISAKKGGVGVTNFIEEIATIIKHNYIDKVAIPSNGPLHDRIRWIERNHFPNERYQVVSLEWNNKQECFQNPSWSTLNDDWILEKNKLKPYND